LKNGTIKSFEKEFSILNKKDKWYYLCPSLYFRERLYRNWFTYIV